MAFFSNKAYKDRPKPDTCSPTLQTLPEFQKRTRRSRTSSRSKCPSETNSPVFVRRARGRVSSSNMGTPRGHVQNPTCRRVLLPRAAVTTDICPSKAQTPSLGALSTTLENSAARVAGAGAVDGAEGDAAEREGSQEQQRAKSVARVSVHVPTAVIDLYGTKLRVIPIRVPSSRESSTRTHRLGSTAGISRTRSTRPQKSRFNH